MVSTPVPCTGPHPRSKGPRELSGEAVTKKPSSLASGEEEHEFWAGDMGSLQRAVTSRLSTLPTAVLGGAVDENAPCADEESEAGPGWKQAFRCLWGLRWPTRDKWVRRTGQAPEAPRWCFGCLHMQSLVWGRVTCWWLTGRLQRRGCVLGKLKGPSQYSQESCESRPWVLPRKVHPQSQLVLLPY